MTTCSRADAGAWFNYPFLTSKERDIETGLDYFLARYYSSTQGRFTSPDEFSGGPDELYDFAEDASENPTFYAELDNPQSLNKYQYTYNNPINLTDDDGHCPLCVAAAAAAVLILTSPDTTHAPTGNETEPLEPSGDGVKTMLTTAAISVVGGPILDKVAGPVARGIVSRLGGSKAAVKAGETSVGAEVSAGVGRGMRNPKVAAKVAEGQARHAELSSTVKAKGWKASPALKDPLTGKTVKPDVVTKGGRPLELKPNMSTGRARGRRQLPAQERATGKKGRVIYYEPKEH